MGFEQGDQPLSVGEFSRWAGTVDQKLQNIAEGQQEHGERLARIESRQEERDRLEMLTAIKHTQPFIKAQQRSTLARVSAGTWTTIVTTGSAAVAGILYRLGWYPAWMEKLVKP
jgi:hypothetical protein